MIRAYLVTFFLLSSIVNANITQAATGATAVVEKFHSTLIAAMKEGKKIGYNGRYAKLEPVINEVLDLSGIAKLTTGKQWNSLTDAQKTAFIDTFTKLTISTYAYQFNEYDDQIFKTVKEQKLPNGNTLVRTLMIESDGNKVHFDYTLSNKSGSWRVRNIIADGVSDLKIKQSEYPRVIGSKGIDGLIKMLKKKIAYYHTEGNKQ